MQVSQVYWCYCDATIKQTHGMIYRDQLDAVVSLQAPNDGLPGGDRCENLGELTLLLKVVKIAK